MEERKLTLAEAEEALKAALKDYTDALEAERETVGAVMPDSVMNTIINYTNQSKTVFAPYESPLTPTERKRLIGTGYKNFGFIEQAFASATANPSLVPPYININTFRDDFQDFERKRNVVEILRQFEEQVSDSVLAASDKAYRHSLGYYNSVREAARQHVIGAEAAYEAMKKYFKRTKHQSEPTEADIERDIRALLHGTKEGRVVVENERPVTSSGKRHVVDEVHKEHIAVKDDLKSKTEE